ncbi:hypothetical protein AVEN_76104-1 [Araneus ventricosus]|uniref:Uncharacterized protein n=1 Tax=Araneus ventricosus TaxID=182803 RepID=A0A4Y2HBR4_ARAVE|nr:hypothetical protein AVEN_76104-1 [Araneus ventricosus]
MFKNVKKEDIVTALTELGETVNIDMQKQMGDLKQKLLTSKEYLEDAQFVNDFLISNVENRKIEEENRKIREEETRRSIEREHELELTRIRATRNDENRSPPPSVTSNGDGDISLDKLIKGVEILTIPVPRKTESCNLFLDSLERAYKHKKVPEEFQAEILLKLLGHKASNVLVYIKEEDFYERKKEKDYAKVKALILKEFDIIANYVRLKVMNP